eukprot:4747581-Alexandrium_andersonii.AAC.1
MKELRACALRGGGHGTQQVASEAVATKYPEPSAFTAVQRKCSRRPSRSFCLTSASVKFTRTRWRSGRLPRRAQAS